MTVRSLGKDLANRIHAGWLNAHGFKKSGATFSRERVGYIERYQIDGSRWNSGEEPWEFDVNVGVQFEGIPLREAKGLWAKAHAIGGLSRIIDEAPVSFSVAASTLEAVSEAVALQILKASEQLPYIVGPAKDRAVAGLLSPLPVPSTWSSGVAT